MGLFPELDARLTAEQLAGVLVATYPRAMLAELVTRLRDEIGTTADGLREVAEWWNGLHAVGLVSHGVRPDKPSAELRKAWDAFQKNETAMECLSDLDKVASEIRAASFVRGGWFRLEKLLRGACNSAGVPICRVLIDGGYRDDKTRRQADDPRGNRSAADEYLARFGS